MSTEVLQKAGGLDSNQSIKDCIIKSLQKWTLHKLLKPVS